MLSMFLVPLGPLTSVAGQLKSRLAEPETDCNEMSINANSELALKYSTSQRNRNSAVGRNYNKSLWRLIEFLFVNEQSSH